MTPIWEFNFKKGHPVPNAGRHFDTSQGTEELGHMEMIAALVYQLTQNMCIEDIKKEGFDAYFVDQSTGNSLYYSKNKKIAGKEKYVFALLYL